ncbi:hypothetical protein IMG5_171040 [Ichthyophthirius multifiliis]|uniref:Transmembrane protein n=1 Tax=Ichthyophthirius multifiliis TaxID=5932 RepID=G0R1K1_ICHMU|nr:hypothetical protein IMG5_171040 [Ichthyophthirius multifiliis]EGR28650.1 hypothetical protein IMG5_171040 [Ichthyophthirius multifiliis]|eukprot:XP_004029886.1 hypothetical protein IMG5_171040 [Ichthyophthirius multifiliis]
MKMKFLFKKFFKKSKLVKIQILKEKNPVFLKEFQNKNLLIKISYFQIQKVLNFYKKMKIRFLSQKSNKKIFWVNKGIMFSILFLIMYIQQTQRSFNYKLLISKNSKCKIKSYQRLFQNKKSLVMQKKKNLMIFLVKFQMEIQLIVFYFIPRKKNWIFFQIQYIFFIKKKKNSNMFFQQYRFRQVNNKCYVKISFFN